MNHKKKRLRSLWACCGVRAGASESLYILWTKGGFGGLGLRVLGCFRAFQGF